MKKIITHGHEARTLLKLGVDTVVDCIKVTLGPAGRNAVLGRHENSPIITNDGVSIAKEIEVENETAQLGVNLVKEATILTDSRSGDGTTTTAVLMQALIEKLFSIIDDEDSLVSKKINTIALKKELDGLVERVLKNLEEQKRDIKDDEVYDVAMVSAEYHAIAQAIADIYNKIGLDGHIEVEEFGTKIEYETHRGIKLDVGLRSPYYETERNRGVYVDVPVFVTNKSFNNAHHFAKLVEEARKAGYADIVVCAHAFSDDVIKRLITTKIKGAFGVIPVAIPSVAGEDALKDVAAITGAKFIDASTLNDKSFEDVLVKENFGNTKKFIGETDGQTIIYEGANRSEEDLKERIESLKQKLEKSNSLYDKLNYKRRISGLTGGYAVLRIGSMSNTERTYLKLKADDAVNAVKSALNYGVVRGGGLALLKASECVRGTFLEEVLKAPYNQIQTNADGVEIPENINDPLHTVQNALKSAASLAGTLITTEVTVAFKNVQPKDEGQN